MYGLLLRSKRVGSFLENGGRLDIYGMYTFRRVMLILYPIFYEVREEKDDQKPEGITA